MLHISQMSCHFSVFIFSHFQSSVVQMCNYYSTYDSRYDIHVNLVLYGSYSRLNIWFFIVSLALEPCNYIQQNIIIVSRRVRHNHISWCTTMRLWGKFDSLLGSLSVFCSFRWEVLRRRKLCILLHDLQEVHTLVTARVCWIGDVIAFRWCTAFRKRSFFSPLQILIKPI